MGLKETLSWVKNEWALFARRDEMAPSDAARWLRQWLPVGARTIGYGVVSITLGPLTADRKASVWAMKQWSKSALAGLGIKVEVLGTERVPAGGVMFASNHQSMLDILLLGAVLPGDFKWAAKRSLMKVPFLGWHLKLAGHVPVDRLAGRRAAVESIKRFQEVLERDKSLLIFPEGTRSEDGQLQAFKNGGFYAAVRANRPVVPVAISGAHGLMDKGAVNTAGAAYQRPVVIRIGDPIFPPAEGSDGRRVVALRDLTRASVEEMLTQSVGDSAAR